MRKTAFIAFFLIAATYLFLFTYRLQDAPPPWYDEIAHLNTAQHVAREGRIWCDFYSNKFREGLLFNSMPLQWILLGACVKIFGLSLFAARLLYVALGAVMLWCLYLLALKMFDRITAFASVILLASSRIFFLNCRQLIPQVPAAAFALMSLLAFYKAREGGAKLFFAASGLLAGLATLSHPTGLGVFLIAAILFLYHRVSIKSYLIYLTFFFITISPYLLYVILNLPEYLAQMKIIANDMYSGQSFLLNILDEIPVRYFKLPPFRVGPGRYIESLAWLGKNLDLRVYAASVASAAVFLLSFFYLTFKKNKSAQEKEL
ncbi:MAG: glycosyltransferase family 39 protein, partial [Candidatus Omnitrophica bacterium]|nr:glycosyltransferase family 39 protein [Candidatus Omnitrophota bacterium]